MLLVNGATLASDNPLRFRKIFLIYNETLVIDDQVRDEKLQHDINREGEAAKTTSISTGKIESMNILLVKKYYDLIKDK